jgi:tetratricopeptide (TPR) repeat protein
MFHHEHNNDEDDDFEKLAWAAIRGDSLELRADALLELARKKLTEDEEPREAGQLALAAVDLFAKLKDQRSQYHSLRVVADCFNALDALTMCLEYLKRAREVAEALLLQSELAQTEYNLSGLLIRLRKYGEALECARRAAAIYENQDDDRNCARAKIAVARALYFVKERTEAIASLEEALLLFKKVEDHVLVAESYARKADILIDCGRITEAIYCHDKSEAIIELISISYLRQPLIFNKARIMASKGLHEMAIPLFNEGLEVFKSVNDPTNICKITFERAKSLAATGKREGALADLKRLAMFIDEMPVIDLEIEEVYSSIWRLVDSLDEPLEGLGMLSLNKGAS